VKERQFVELNALTFSNVTSAMLTLSNPTLWSAQLYDSRRLTLLYWLPCQILSPSVWSIAPTKYTHQLQHSIQTSTKPTSQEFQDNIPKHKHPHVDININTSLKHQQLVTIEKCPSKHSFSHLFWFYSWVSILTLFSTLLIGNMHQAREVLELRIGLRVMTFHLLPSTPSTSLTYTTHSSNNTLNFSTLASPNPRKNGFHNSSTASATVTRRLKLSCQLAEVAATPPPSPSWPAPNTTDTCSSTPPSTWHANTDSTVSIWTGNSRKTRSTCLT